VSQVFDFALIGLGAGALYALAAIGLVLVYRGSGVVNFAQGAMGMIGAYAFYETRTVHHLPAFVAVACGMALSGLLGALYHILIMRYMRDASTLAKVVATLALLVVLQSVAALKYGALPKIVASMLPRQSVKIFGASVGEDRIWILGIVIVLAAVLWTIYKYTTFGVATTAVAENPRAAAALAVSPNVIAAVNWAVGSALGALAAILLVPITSLGTANLTFLVIPILAAAVIGKFSSFPITTLAGLAIGVAQSEVTRYVTSPGWATAVPFIFVAAILITRGRTVAGRDERFGRMPSVGDGRIPPFLVAGGIVATLLCIWVVFPANWLDALQLELAIVIVLFSFVVVTGYCGQVSLAQMAFGGLGALVTSYLVASQGWPLEIAALVGIAAIIPIGVIVGLAGVRTRGVNLAIVTLGFAISVDSIIFQNPKYSGGIAMYKDNDPTFFGIHISGLDFPKRYATLTLFFLVLAGLAVANLRRSRVGRRLIAVRTNERAAAALGVSVVGAKLYAFVLGGMIAALGGIVLTFQHPTLAFSNFPGLQSVILMQNAVLGGVGNLAGPLIGSGFTPGTVGQNIFSFLGSHVALYLSIASGVGLLSLLTWAPDGIAEINRRFNEPIINAVRGVFPARRQTDPLDPAIIRAVAPAPARTLTLTGVCVRFGGTRALQDLSLTVAPGEIVGLIGPNGAGKSTAIDAITGFVTPVSGHISIDGTSIDGWSPERRARAGLSRSFQSLELFDDLSVLENIQAACDNRDLAAYVTNPIFPGRDRLTSDAQTAIADFGLQNDLHTVAKQLPYAKRRLLAVARAVAGGNSILLLDEPASGLGATEWQHLANTIRTLARTHNLGVLLIEHNVDMVLQTCDRVYALDFGIVIGQGTPDDIRTNPAVVDAYLGTTKFKKDALQPSTS
jgi:ABC-type branched-subunit amino acid transport system ATPase component/branched-subunit amino acid ABC-type transport system permease component